MKNILIALLFAGIDLYAQAPSIQWQKSYGGIGDEFLCGMVQTMDGGYILTGYTGSLNTGDVNGVHGQDDAWVVKTDSLGNLQWQRALGGSQGDYGMAICQTTDKGYIMAGYTASTDGDVLSMHYGNIDSWLVKLDSAGNIVWEKQYGSSSGDWATDIKPTSDGNYIIAAVTTGNDHDVSGNHNVGSNDFWIYKIDPSGTLLWQRCYGGSNDETVKQLNETKDHGFIITGSSNSNNGNVTVHNGTLNYFDVWTIQVDSIGGLQWQKSFGGIYSEGGYAGIESLGSGYLVSASTQSPNGGDITGFHGNTDWWLARLDSSGVIQWKNTYGGSDVDDQPSVCQTSDSGYVISGCTGSNNADVSGLHGNVSVYDYWVVKLDKNGNINWQKCLGGTDNDVARQIQITKDGGYAIAGHAYSTDGDITSPRGGFDFWLVKLRNAMPLGLSSDIDGELELRPNPTSGIISVSLPENTTGILVTNTMGQVVYEHSIGSTVQKMQIDLSQLDQGMYWVTFRAPEHTITRKVVRQ